MIIALLNIISLQLYITFCKAVLEFKCILVNSELFGISSYEYDRLSYNKSSSKRTQVNMIGFVLNKDGSHSYLMFILRKICSQVYCQNEKYILKY